MHYLFVRPHAKAATKSTTTTLTAVRKHTHDCDLSVSHIFLCLPIIQTIYACLVEEEDDEEEEEEEYP